MNKARWWTFVNGAEARDVGDVISYETLQRVIGDKWPNAIPYLKQAFLTRRGTNLRVVRGQQCYALAEARDVVTLVGHHEQKGLNQLERASDICEQTRGLPPEISKVLEEQGKDLRACKRQIQRLNHRVTRLEQTFGQRLERLEREHGMTEEQVS